MGQILNRNIIDWSSTIPISTLNVNGLKIPVKKQKLSYWIKKQDQIICCLKEILVKPKGKRKK